MEHYNTKPKYYIKCDHSKHRLYTRNTGQYRMEYCPVCNHITNFWFKSFPKRLKSLFKIEKNGKRKNF